SGPPWLAAWVGDGPAGDARGSSMRHRQAVLWPAALTIFRPHSLAAPLCGAASGALDPRALAVFRRQYSERRGDRRDDELRRPPRRGRRAQALAARRRPRPATGPAAPRAERAAA